MGDNGANLTLNTNGPTSNTGTSNSGNSDRDRAPSAESEPARSSDYFHNFDCKWFSEKLAHFLVPGITVILVADGDGQSTACQHLVHNQADVALGESVGLVFST